MIERAAECEWRRETAISTSYTYVDCEIVQAFNKKV